jgi:hypothetical protein
MPSSTKDILDKQQQQTGYLTPQGKKSEELRLQKGQTIFQGEEGMNMAERSRKAQEAWEKSREVEVDKIDPVTGKVTKVKTTSLAGIDPVNREQFFEDLPTTQTTDAQGNPITIPDYQADPVAYGKAQQAYQEALSQSPIAILDQLLFGSPSQQTSAESRLPGQLGRFLNVGESAEQKNYRDFETRGKITQLQRRADALRRSGNPESENEARLIDAEIASLQNELQPISMYYNPAMQGEGGRGELRSPWSSSFYNPAMQGEGGRGELSALLSQLLRNNRYQGPVQTGGEVSPLSRGGPIQFLAGGGTINKPTMAVVGEAGPELAMLQPGDAILPLSMPQANQLLKAGTPGFQTGTRGRPSSFGEYKKPTGIDWSFLKQGPPTGGTRNRPSSMGGMMNLQAQPTSVIQPQPDTATTTMANPFQTGGATRTVPSYVPPGPGSSYKRGVMATPAPGLAGGPSDLVPPKKEPTEPPPTYQWADGAGINSAELLKASRAGQYTPAMAAEVLETLSDVTADVQELESELALLEADEDIELNDPKIIQKRQDLNDARRVFAEVQQVYRTASANQENFLSRQITETQFGREADIQERERQEDYERKLAATNLAYQRGLEATELQYGRSQEEDAEILARQAGQNEAVASLLTQLFGSIGINIPEEARGALTTQNLSSLLGTFMNLQQQQQAAPQVARLGFA